MKMTYNLASNLRLLDCGASVARLHKSLIATGHSVDVEETKKRRFGASTLEALKAFQRVNNLTANGIANAETFAALRVAAKKRRRLTASDGDSADPRAPEPLPPEEQPTRPTLLSRMLGRTQPTVPTTTERPSSTASPSLTDRSADRLSVRVVDLALDTGDIGRSVKATLTDTLKKHIRNAFKAPSEEIIDAIDDLDIDLGAVQELPFREFITNIVLKLLSDPDLVEHLYRSGLNDRADEEKSVNELLGMHRNPRDVEALAGVVRKIRSTEIADIAALSPEAAAAIADIDVGNDPSELRKLTEAGTLTSRERDDVIVAAKLARLTDDNFTAVRALKDRGIDDALSLIGLRRDDWVKLINDNDIVPPEGETAESYAELLETSVERSMPGVFAAARFTMPDPQQSNVLDGTAVLDRIPQGGDPVFRTDGTVRVNLDLDGLSDADAADVQRGIEHLNALSNRIGARDILNDTSLSTAEKRARIDKRLSALASVSAARPNLNIRKANLVGLKGTLFKEHTVDLAEVPDDERPHVRRALMGLQRATHLTENYDEADRLLAAGLNTADRIADLVSSGELAEQTGLPPARARDIYARAIDMRSHTMHVVNAIEDLSGHRRFDPQALDGYAARRVTTEAATPPLINILRDIPGYEDLFGPQNYCKCRDCQSIFSAAAYFVDLMRFIEAKISGPNFDNQNLSGHRLNLKSRRPDLWTLPLTCENTDTLVMYLTIVNEVLVAFLQSLGGDTSNIFEFLATQADRSFSQPFNLPQAEMRLYLDHLGVHTGEIAALFDPDNRGDAAHRLGLSASEAQTIVTPALEAVGPRFLKQQGELFQEHDAAVLTRLMDVDREMLDRLFAIEFIKQDLEIRAELKSETDDLVGFEEIIHIERNGVIASHNDTEAFLDRLHRFRRLQRALSWEPEELGLALHMIAPDGQFNQEHLSQIADIVSIREQLELTVDEVVAIADAIPEREGGFETRSLSEELLDGQQNFEVRHPGLGSAAPGPAPRVSADLGKLIGATRTKETNFLELLLHVVPQAEIDAGQIGEPHVSGLYRSARLAQALDLTQFELMQIEQVVPGLREAAIPQERLRAVLALADIKTQASANRIELSQLVSQLGIDLENKLLRERAFELLNAVREQVRDDERRRVIPGDFDRLDGISPENARAMLQHLSGGPGWLVAVPQLSGEGIDGSTVRYTITELAPPSADPVILLEAAQADSGPFTPGGNTDAASKAVLMAFAAELERHHPTTLVREAINSQAEISPIMMATLAPMVATEPEPLITGAGLIAWLDSDGMRPPEELFVYVVEILRLRDLVVGTFAAPAEVVEFVAENRLLFGAEPGAPWNWQLLEGLAATMAVSSDVRADFLAALALWDGQTFPLQSYQHLANVLGTDEARIGNLISALPELTEPFELLRKLEHGIRLMQRTGLDAQALRQMLEVETYSGSVAARDLVRGAVRASYPDQRTWAEIERPFTEKTESLKRNALVDWILSRPEMGFENARDIYHYFLLDPEMDGCFMTSRVVNAISTCQLYFQRCLMGLEQSDDLVVDVKGGEKTRQEWMWRKSYRVWEANRKVFLYPENYISPDLQFDSSHIFRQSIDSIQQGNLDEAHIEKVFKEYLDEFCEVGQMQVTHTMAHKGDEDWNDRPRVYEFIGRTPTSPHRYFTRTYRPWSLPARQWGLWKPIDLDIGADVATALRRNGQLQLFWTDVALNSDADRAMAGQQQTGEMVAEEAQGDAQVQVQPVPISVSYATQNAAGRWSQPHSFLFYSFLFGNTSRSSFWYYRYSVLSNRIYVRTPIELGLPSRKHIELVHAVKKQYLNTAIEENDNFSIGLLRVSDNALFSEFGKRLPPNGVITKTQDHNPFVPMAQGLLLDCPALRLNRQIGEIQKFHKPPRRSNLAEVDVEIGFSASNSESVLRVDNNLIDNIMLNAVDESTKDTVLKFDGAQFIILNRREIVFEGDEFVDIVDNATHRLHPIDTRRPHKMRETLIKEGMDALLSLRTQGQPDQHPNAKGLFFENLYRVSPTMVNWLPPWMRSLAEFIGPHGQYLWEFHFHLPFLAAHSLNARGKHREADLWYRKIFDPVGKLENINSYWRFAPFIFTGREKLRDILTNQQAISAYKNDPFNPFAIARLRPSAFQKTIVMRYIDNLMDWGDELFRKDTRESINEALLLYTMAADLLGERPRETGECDVVDSMTYEDIQKRGVGGEFLIELENYLVLHFVDADLLPLDPEQFDPDWSTWEWPGARPEEPGPGEVVVANPLIASIDIPPLSALRAERDHRNGILATASDTTGTDSDVTPADDITFQPARPDPDPPSDIEFDIGQATEPADPDGGILGARKLGFCVPPNDTLLGYWDRIEDRLYKIRHCMNIDGVVRQLALFQPPIDPMLIVRARAAGLSLEEALDQISAQPPHHRFEVLLERARRFAGTAQHLGGQLLSALERKDEAELTLLRSVHEQEILDLVRRQKEDALTEAKEARKQLDDQEEILLVKEAYFDERLASEDILKKTEKEVAATNKRLDVQSELSLAAGSEKFGNEVIQKEPRWSSGLGSTIGIQYIPGAVHPTPIPPTLPRIGFRFHLGNDTSGAYGSENLNARYPLSALSFRDGARKFTAEADALSEDAKHELRQKEWELEANVVAKERTVLKQQMYVADIRIELAKKDLETHDRQQNHAKEVYEFSKVRFTNLGLYTYLTSNLTRLYREAYDMAFDVARKAEQAYRFELGDDAYFLKPDNWTQSKAGLLAADRLLLQLQAMETSYLERDRRRQEVILPCSLSEIDPDALLELQETGAATFEAPSWWLDLYYPGQFRRRLEAVRLSIHCVTGPYGNVAAKLTLLESAVRTQPSAASESVGTPVGRNTSITASSAVQDPGVFELRFDAPKHPPFKGAGAESKWRLELPSTNRIFDYATISDAVLELSYTADTDGALQLQVEGRGEGGAPGAIDAMLSGPEGYVRIISLRRDFPAEFHRLANMEMEIDQEIELKLDKKRLLPHWLATRNLRIAGIQVGMRPKTLGAFDAPLLRQADLSISLNGVAEAAWAETPAMLGGLPFAVFAANIDLQSEDAVLRLGLNSTSSVEIGDILLRLSIRV